MPANIRWTTSWERASLVPEQGDSTEPEAEKMGALTIRVKKKMERRG